MSLVRTLAVLSLFLFMPLAVAHPGHGSDSWSVPEPTGGTEVVLPYHGVESIWRFDATPETMFVGYVEPRKVYVATALAGSYEEGSKQVFDAATGLHVAQGHPYGYDVDFEPLGLWGAGADFTSFRHGGFMIHTALPESVLWGQGLAPGDAWELPVWDPYCGEHAALIEVGADHTATITQECAISGWDYTFVWALDFGDEPGPFAETRTWALTAENDTVVHKIFEYRNATVTEGSGPTLQFDGERAPITNGRDPDLTYGTSEGLPFDPEPYADFDVRQAAEAALDLDLPAVHAFNADADEWRLHSAHVFLSGLGPQWYWSIMFTDRNGLGLHVSFEAVRLSPEILVVTSESASLEDLRESPRQPVELAGVGDAVRSMVASAEGTSERPDAFSYYRNSHDAVVTVSFAALCDRNVERSLALRLGDGIVSGSGHGYSAYHVAGEPVGTGTVTSC